MTTRNYGSRRVRGWGVACISPYSKNMPVVRLSPEKIRALMATVPEWRLVSGQQQTTPDTLMRSYRFRTFEETWAFLTRVAMRAHRTGHHPKVTNVYTAVELELTTHDVGGLSELDFQLARAYERAAKQEGGTGKP